MNYFRQHLQRIKLYFTFYQAFNHTSVDVSKGKKEVRQIIGEIHIIPHFLFVGLDINGVVLPQMVSNHRIIRQNKALWVFDNLHK